eukprot:964375-Rhodomonas_salina.1
MALQATTRLVLRLWYDGTRFAEVQSSMHDDPDTGTPSPISLHTSGIAPLSPYAHILYIPTPISLRLDPLSPYAHPLYPYDDPDTSTFSLS